MNFRVLNDCKKNIRKKVWFLVINMLILFFFVEMVGIRSYFKDRMLIN